MKPQYQFDKGVLVMFGCLLLAVLAIASTNYRLAYVLPLTYTTNKYHDIQTSTDMVHWSTILKGCTGIPTTNADITVTNRGGSRYWRAVPSN